MRRFLCPTCSGEIHFNNSQCISCGAVLGYVPLRDQILILDTALVALDGTQQVCANRKLIGCNWLCDVAQQRRFCLSCRHTTKIPNLSDGEKRGQWERVEQAKRRLFYALIKFRFPLDTHPGTTKGALHFEVLADETHPDGAQKTVMTGHYNGRITLNIDEADDAIRERNRTALGEPYRTLVGHFRHEVAHYYWDRLIAGTDMIDACRACFGDERQGYGAALRTYYASGAPQNWQDSFVSEYASAHPWEDFAETWAHYFHMVGGLETAYAYGLDPQPLHVGALGLVQLEDPYHVSDLDRLVERWIPLTVAMNAMNRSMGNSDYYPFVLTPRISAKLKFVHDLIARVQPRRDGARPDSVVPPS